MTYSILRGDNQAQFAVDQDSGYISVSDFLDREVISSYVLEVLAKDNGLPVLSRQILVTIDISDANDNAPLFSQSNYTAVIQVGFVARLLTGVHYYFTTKKLMLIPILGLLETTFLMAEPKLFNTQNALSKNDDQDQKLIEQP